MKKTTLLLVLLTLYCINAVKAAVTNDMGRDWNTSTSKTVLAATGIGFPTVSTSYPIIVDPNAGVAGDEMTYNLSSTTTTPAAVNADASKNAVYKNTTDYACPLAQINGTADFSTTFPAYFEGKVNTETTTISGLSINGTSNNTTYGVTAAILFSDATTFNESKVTYTTFTLPKCRAGAAAIAITVPAGTKSYRIYMQAKLVDNGNGTYMLDNTNGTAITGVTTAYAPRIAYVNATLALPFASVTVNYYDADNTSTLIKSVVATDQPIDAVYTATATDKASFVLNGNYYAFSSMQLDAQTILANNSTHVDVLMKKATAYSGTYDWTGVTDGNWNELVANFNAGGNSLAYQVGNAVTFPEAASNKTISIPNSMNLAAQNVTVSGSGYVFSGAGVLSGTGSFIINPGAGNTTSLNITNNLTSGVTVQSGAVQLVSNASAASITMLDGTKLILNGTETFGSSTTKKSVVGATTVNLDVLEASTDRVNSNVHLNFAATGNTTTTLNVGLGINTQTADTTNFNLLGVGQSQLPAGIQLNISKSTTGIARVQIPRDALTARKLNLGAGVALTRGDGNGGVFIIGEIIGATGSILEGERSSSVSKEITYTIGGLNTASTFAGKIQQYGGNALNNNVNLVKTGTGILNITSANSTHNGSVTVSGGTLKVTGSLGKATTSFTVSGTSTIAAADTGKIVTSSLAMSANDTLSILPKAVVSINAAVGTALTNVVIEINADTTGVLNLPADLATGTKLIVKALATPATSTKTYKLINSSTGITFTEVVLPSAKYTYNQATGLLTYDITTSNTGFKSYQSSSFYTSIMNQELAINGNDLEAISIFNMLGQPVKLIEKAGMNNHINVSNFVNGAYLVKVRFTDGSVKTQKIIIKK